MGSLASAIRFLWTATTGYRTRPWQSPYLRWRMETYTGKPAADLVPRDFLKLAIAERRQLGRFLRWLGSMDRLANGRKA